MMLMIQGNMDVIRTSFLGFLVILLCVSSAVSSDYRSLAEEAFLNQLVDPATGRIDENLADWLWISCGKDSNDLKEAFEDLKLHLLEETPSTTYDVNTKGSPFAKEKIHKLIDVLHPQLKQALSDCIRKKNLLFPVSGEDSGFTTWYTRYIESLLRWPDVPRRILATQNSGSAPAPAPAPGPASSSSPASAPAPSPDFALDPWLSSPPPPPPPRAPSPRRSPSKVDPLDDLSPANTTKSGKRTDSSKTIIIACVVTAAVTFVFAALFFLLCCRRGSGIKLNDERPLLSLSLSDYSGGSSHAYAFGSIKEQKLDHQSSGNESSLHKKSSSNGKHFESDAVQISLDGKSSFGAVAGAAKASVESSGASGNTNSLLPLPPGRAPPGLPPLKPPPGRADPLPPEPPAPIRASPPPPPPPVPSKASPPPPPPPSMRPASANVGPRPPGPPPPPPPGTKPGPRAPPPPGGPAPPRPPPLGSKMARPPSGRQRTSNAISGEGSGAGDDANAPKAKLKPFFWDKVAANPEHSMVWNQIKAGSFQFNEEMIETLFGYSATEKNKNDKKKESSADQTPQFIQLLDPKKSQNLAILLRALNVTTEEVCDALSEGNELPVELLQTLLKMAPTQDEELKLRLFNGEITQLGPAERFLKVLVDIPFAFKRMEALLFMCTLNEEVTITRESFETLEIACKELRSSRLFLKLLEAVLKTGNRMNDGTFRGGAQAFKLDTLLKLADVKGVDGKTTLLHFVVQEIIRTEGLRAARVARESKSFTSIKSDDLLDDVPPESEEHYRSLGLEVVSKLSSDLENVKKAAALDADNLTGTVSKLGHALLKTRTFLNTEMKSTDEDSGFHEILKSFVQNAEADVMSLLEEEKRIMALVKSTGDYFHGNTQKDEGLRLFGIVRDFLIIVDKVCKEIRDAPIKPAKVQKKQVSNASSSSEPRFESPSPDPRQKLFPAIAERRMENSSSSSSSSSDDES
ncbi:Actin-binding FH2/DRF autoregulatory [Corchorus capsularis]|uniref:Formin-like protein n=1 Tax=Corchorus capsularis TaxID=210143 RepID=A0A1R3ID81_COCAP|nr:Actin-binding FH2/DRF autoregulatory [Corchorus capsularis]